MAGLSEMGYAPRPEVHDTWRLSQRTVYEIIGEFPESFDATCVPRSTVRYEIDPGVCDHTNETRIG